MLLIAVDIGKIQSVHVALDHTQINLCKKFHLTHKAPNTTIAEFANTVDPDRTNEPSSHPCYLDLQCLPSSP